MEALKANPKYRCCCGKIHATTGTQIICVFFLLQICLFVYLNFPQNIAPAAIIAFLVIVTLFGTFFENHYLVLPVYWILTLTVSGIIFKLTATIPQYFISDKEFAFLDFIIEILILSLLTWFTFILKSCYDYFKWLKSHTNLEPLQAFVYYFQNVMPKMPEKQQLVIENEGNDVDDDSDESSGKASDTSESNSTASMTSVECQTENVER